MNSNPQNPSIQNSSFARNATGKSLPDFIKKELLKFLGEMNTSANLGDPENFFKETYASIQSRTDKMLKDAETFLSIISKGAIASNTSIDAESKNNGNRNTEKQNTEIIKNVSSIKVSVEALDEQNKEIKKNTEVSASVANVNEESMREEENEDDKFKNTLLDYLDKILRQLKKPISAESGGILGKIGSFLSSNMGLVGAAGGLGAGALGLKTMSKTRASRLAKIKAIRAARGKGGKIAGIARAIKKVPGSGKTKLLVGLLAALGIYSMFSGSEEEEERPEGREEPRDEELSERDATPVSSTQEYGLNDFAVDAGLSGVVAAGTATLASRAAPAAATQATTATAGAASAGVEATTATSGAASAGVEATSGALKTGSKLAGAKAAARSVGKIGGPLTALVESGMAIYEYQEESAGLTQDVQQNIITEAEKDAREDRMMSEKIGQAAGATTGALAGMAAGAAIGSVVPVAGTIIGAAAGAIIGAGLGWLGGWAGKELGGKIAEAVDETTMTQEQIEEKRAKFESLQEGGITLKSESETEINLSSDEALRTLQDIKEQSIRDTTENNMQTVINNNVVSGSGNTQTNTEVNNPNHSENPANLEPIAIDSASGNNQGTMPA